MQLVHQQYKTILTIRKQGADLSKQNFEGKALQNLKVTVEMYCTTLMFKFNALVVRVLKTFENFLDVKRKRSRSLWGKTMASMYRMDDSRDPYQIF